MRKISNKQPIKSDNPLQSSEWKTNINCFVEESIKYIITSRVELKAKEVKDKMREQSKVNK
jgi:hypothetical protein